MIPQKVLASLMQLHSSSAINVFSGNQTFVLQVHALPFQLQGFEKKKLMYRCMYNLWRMQS